MDTGKIGKVIAQKRKEKHMTQDVLSQKLNVSAKTISHWENGYTLPDISLLIPLSKALGITVYELLSGELENGDTMNAVEKQEQEPGTELDSEKRDKELEMTVHYAESNMKDYKHKTFNIFCYVVILMLVLLFMEVLREKQTKLMVSEVTISFLFCMQYDMLIISLICN